MQYQLFISSSTSKCCKLSGITGNLVKPVFSGYCHCSSITNGFSEYYTITVNRSFNGDPGFTLRQTILGYAANCNEKDQTGNFKNRVQKHICVPGFIFVS